MNASQIFIFVSIAALILIIYLVLFLSSDHNHKTVTPYALLAFGFVLAAIILGGNHLLGYGLIGMGVILAIVDVIIKLRHKLKRE